MMIHRLHLAILSLLCLTACGGTPLEEVADRTTVMVRLWADGSLSVNLVVLDATEDSCPTLPQVEATIGEVELDQVDPGGWVEPSFSLDGSPPEGHCSPARFVLSAGKLTSVSPGTPLRLEDSSHTIAIGLPTLRDDRAVRLVLPAEPRLALGTIITVRFGAVGDERRTLGYSVRSSALCFVHVVDQGIPSNNEATFAFLDTNCPPDADGTLVVRADYDLGIDTVSGVSLEQVDAQALVVGDIYLKPAAP